LASIGCKLIFDMEYDWVMGYSLSIFNKVIIDYYTYIITKIGYPVNGFCNIEAVGVWN